MTPKKKARKLSIQDGYYKNLSKEPNIQITIVTGQILKGEYIGSDPFTVMITDYDSGKKMLIYKSSISTIRKLKDEELPAHYRKKNTESDDSNENKEPIESATQIIMKKKRTIRHSPLDPPPAEEENFNR